MFRLLFFAAIGAAISAQTLVPADEVAEAARKMLPVPGEATFACELAPISPELSYSLRYVTGYNENIRLTQFLGPGHSVTTLLRIAAPWKDPVYLRRSVDLPEVPPIGGKAETAGGFYAGAGKYQVGAVAYDERGRVCRSDWELVVKGADQSSEPPVMAPDLVAELSIGALRRGSAGSPSIGRLTLLVNVAPKDEGSVVPAWDAIMLTSAIAALLEKMPAANVRLILFNLDQHKELYRDENFGTRDLDKVAGAIRGVQLGLVDVATLQDKTGGLDLLAKLTNGELRAESLSDLAIFLGPRAGSQSALPDGAVTLVSSRHPKFYFVELLPAAQAHFSRDPLAKPAPRSSAQAQRHGTPDPLRVERTAQTGPTHLDIISQAVSKAKGKTFYVYNPADFEKAVAKMVPKT